MSNHSRMWHCQTWRGWLLLEDVQIWSLRFSLVLLLVFIIVSCGNTSFNSSWPGCWHELIRFCGIIFSTATHEALCICIYVNGKAAWRLRNPNDTDALESRDLWEVLWGRLVGSGSQTTSRACQLTFSAKYAASRNSTWDKNYPFNMYAFISHKSLKYIAVLLNNRLKVGAVIPY